MTTPARKTKPILFTGPMVRAILREIEQPGTGKTQTRRLLKPQPDHRTTKCFVCRNKWMGEGSATGGHGTAQWDPWRPLPYGIGDLLWVRETWGKTLNVDGQKNWPGRPHIALPPDTVDRAMIWAADGDWEWCDGDGFHSGKSYWKPSIHMPRLASRLTLEVTGVKVERLQDISEADAQAEGCDKAFEVRDLKDAVRKIAAAAAAGEALPSTYRCGYAALWNDINGAGAWADNPWVVAVTFVPHLINVDAFLARSAVAA